MSGKDEKRRKRGKSENKSLYIKLKAAPVCPTRKIFSFIFIVRLFFFRFGKKEEQSKATDNKINVDRITINEVGKKSI